MEGPVFGLRGPSATLQSGGGGYPARGDGYAAVFSTTPM